MIQSFLWCGLYHHPSISSHVMRANLWDGVGGASAPHIAVLRVLPFGIVSEPFPSYAWDLAADYPRLYVRASSTDSETMSATVFTIL